MVCDYMHVRPLTSYFWNIGAACPSTMEEGRHCQSVTWRAEVVPLTNGGGQKLSICYIGEGRVHAPCSWRCPRGPWTKGKIPSQLPLFLGLPLGHTMGGAWVWPDHTYFRSTSGHSWDQNSTSGPFPVHFRSIFGSLPRPLLVHIWSSGPLFVHFWLTPWGSMPLRVIGDLNEGLYQFSLCQSYQSSFNNYWCQSL